MWKRVGIGPRGLHAGAGPAAAAGVVPACHPAQDGAQLAPAPQGHCGPHWHCGPHEHCGPQVPLVCSAVCWQPQVQPLPGQGVQLQEVCSVAFMVGTFQVASTTGCLRWTHYRCGAQLATGVCDGRSAPVPERSRRSTGRWRHGRQACEGRCDVDPRAALRQHRPFDRSIAPEDPWRRESDHRAHAAVVARLRRRQFTVASAGRVRANQEHRRG